jgi:TetR/AcrR family transcriptional regulator
MPAKRKKPPHGEARTRESILLAAIEEFALRGYDGARTEHIARSAKVNKAMLHYYYHDKQTLYDAVLESLYGYDPDTELLVEKLSNAELNCLQTVRVFLIVLIRKHADPRSDAFRRILSWELAGGKNNLQPVAQKYLVPRIAMMAEVLQKGIEDGQLRCPNPTFAVWSLISQVAFYFMYEKTYRGSPIYTQLYEQVPHETLLEYILQNFIAAYAVDKSIRSELPPEIENLAQTLADKMVTPALRRV